jgi:Transposase DDE domain
VTLGSGQPESQLPGTASGLAPLIASSAGEFVCCDRLSSRRVAYYACRTTCPRLLPPSAKLLDVSELLYRKRGSIEREFGRLKHEWALLPLRVRGIERVRLHADLTILAKLTARLAGERATPQAA